MTSLILEALPVAIALTALGAAAVAIVVVLAVQWWGER